VGQGLTTPRLGQSGPAANPSLSLPQPASSRPNDNGLADGSLPQRFGRKLPRSVTTKVSLRASTAAPLCDVFERINQMSRLGDMKVKFSNIDGISRICLRASKSPRTPPPPPPDLAGSMTDSARSATSNTPLRFTPKSTR
jgi:hypothetical protein